jgi:hypothetical protein
MRGAPQFTKGSKAWDVLSEGLERYARHPAMGLPEHTVQLAEPVKRQLADYGANITSAGRKLTGNGQSRIADVGGRLGPRASHFVTDGVRENDAMAEAGEEPAALPLEAAKELGMQRALKRLDEHSQRQMAHRARVLLLEGRPRGKSGSGRMLDSLDNIVQETRELIDTIQGDPQGFLDSVDDSLGDVEQTHPSLKAAMQARTVNVLSYLHSQLPPPAGQTLDNPEGFPPSFQKSFEFALKATGAADPAGTLHDIAAGDAFPQQVEAFRQNWPELYFQLGQEVVAQAASVEVSPERARYLDQVLGLGGQLSPTMSPSLAATMETARNILQQQPQNPSRTTTTGASIADNFATRRGARRALRRSV